MKKFVIVMSMALSIFPACAGISSGSSGLVVVVAVSEPRTVPLSLLVPADFVSVPLRIASDQKNTALAYEETRQTIELIVKKAKDTGRFQTSMGVVSLAQRQSKFGISSGSWSEPAASAEIYLLVPFTNVRDSIFGAGAEAARFVEALKLPGKARCELGRLELAIQNPEQYRSKLLGLVAEEIKKTREALAPQGGAKVEGLEGSVMVRQADERNVELFMDYRLSVTVVK